MPRFAFFCVGVIAFSAYALAVEPIPREPVEIGSDPQFVFDSYIIDNQWGRKFSRDIVRRVYHAPVKHPIPVIAGHGGYVCALKDEQANLIRLWYQASKPGQVGGAERTVIAYAQSTDGLAWERPVLNLHEWQGTKANNVVYRGANSRRASSPFALIDVPERDRRGYRFLMTYMETDGIRVIASHDGIHWEADTHLKKIHSDTQNSPVYDPVRDEYVIFCRAKHLYRHAQGDILDTGESRRIARMTAKSLWEPWNNDPQNILLPDELDERAGFVRFYGMPTRYYGRIFWGALWCFRGNDDVHTELAWSRDGVRFDRPLDRFKFIGPGSEDAWDDGMAFGSMHWIEMGREWWFYYSGWDGPHGNINRTPGIGLARLRKEGFISMRGPKAGGVLATRSLRWPGGPLLVNATALEGGELKVRVTDERRKPLSGFDYDDCAPFTGDDVAHEVRWKGRSLTDLAGTVLRLEFHLKNADLYTFRAAGR